MAGYMILGKFRQGPPDMSNMEGNISGLKVGAESMGARIVGLWGLMGRFDILLVIDAPDEMTAVSIAGLLGGSLKTSTETVRAFAEDEMATLAKQMAR